MAETSTQAERQKKKWKFSMGRRHRCRPGVCGMPGAGSDANSLRERIIEFEASHPNLAAVVNRLIDSLGQMGI